MSVDQDKLGELLGRFVTDLGATFAAGNVVIGHRLGLYRALAAGPARVGELAERTRTSPRYIAEWLRGQAAGGYVEYDPATEAYSMTEEQAFALANPDGGVYVPGAFVLALGTLKAEPRITEAFRTGGGMGWHEHDENVFTGCEQFFRPGYIANLIPSWIPALDGVQDKLRSGAKVADIGCGLGASTVLLAREYPESRFTGSDYHDQSIEIARKRAADAGVADRISFEVASAASFSGTGYDLAATFDCLHDMGDPLAAARPDGQVTRGCIFHRKVHPLPSAAASRSPPGANATPFRPRLPGPANAPTSPRLAMSHRYTHPLPQAAARTSPPGPNATA